MKRLGFTLGFLLFAMSAVLSGCGGTIFSGSTTASQRAGAELPPSYLEWVSTPGIIGAFVGGKTEAGCVGNCPRTSSVPATSAGVAVSPGYYGSAYYGAPYYSQGYDPGGRATLPYWAPYFPPGRAGTGCWDASGNPVPCR